MGDRTKDAAQIAPTTLAGGQINADWKYLPLAVASLSVLLTAGGAEEPALPGWREASFVVFRCGTAVRVQPADPEFAGYLESGYEFPEHRAEDARTVGNIMDDNARVWEAQRVLPEPAGKAVRQAYAALVAQGYPYPGCPDSDRTVASLGLVTESAGELVCVCWPNLDPDQRAFNLAFVREGAEVGQAVAAAGELRRYDYMFPEVAAVVTATGALWAYRDAGAELWTRRPADGRALQFGPGDGPSLTA